MITDFATGLAANTQRKGFLNVLNDHNPKRRASRLARMESHARVHLGKTTDQNVDWSAPSIDWPSLLAFLLKILPIILMLFP